MHYKSLLCTVKLYLCFGVLFFTSCKYESTELNFHTINSPEESPEVTLNLADVSAGQTIYIYSPTNLLYSINSSSGSIVKQEFFLNNKSLNSTQEGLLVTPADIVENSSNTIRVEVELSSGTGSLAEVLGEEKSQFEFTYPIKYVNPEVDLKINQRISSSKKMEIYWNKPTVEGAEIAGYQIYNFSNLDQVLIKDISNAEETTFIDEDYSYGAKTYKIITRYKDGKLPDKEAFYSVQYKIFTSEYFEANSLKNLNLGISWSHPDGIENKYVLVWKDHIQTIPLGENSVEVERPAFPFREEQYYELYILPEQADIYDYQKYPKVINYFKEAIYSEAKDPAFMLEVHADYKNNLILQMHGLKTGDGIRSYNISDHSLNSNNNDHVKYPFYLSNFKVSPITGKIAVHLRSHIFEIEPKIEVYSDYTFTKKIGSYPTGDFPTYYLTGDDKILIANSNLYKIKIFDLNSGKLLSEKTEGTQFASAISVDGKYTASYVSGADEWYRIYKYEDDKYTLIRDQRSSRIKNNIVFHPTIHNQVVIQSIDNYFTIFELPSFKVIKKVPGEFLTIDQFTGKMIFKDEYFGSNGVINVLDNTYNNVIFSLRTGNYFQQGDVRLINNNIILYNNYIKLSQ